MSILLIIFIGNSGCREEFRPEVDKYEDLLVVDGMVTNQPPPYAITLSKTSDVNTPDFQPLSGCSVHVYEQGGENSMAFEEDQPGTYKSDPEGTQAQSGEAYKLTILTPAGERYETDFITMKAPVDVDTVTTELQFNESNEYPRPLGGYQFFISTDLAPAPDYYFLWKMKETYEYYSNFLINSIYREQGFEHFPNRDSLYTCYKTQNVKQIFVGSTQGLSNPKITKEPLHYVNTETKRLQARYSLLVKQYSINQEAYLFWSAVKNQVSSGDFLFASQPYQIRGNVNNSNNPDEAVMGFFTVGAVSEKRIFADRPDAEFFYQECTANTDLTALSYITPDQFPVYLTYTSSGLAYASDYCFDCTLWGGVLEKPDFWRNKKEYNIKSMKW